MMRGPRKQPLLERRGTVGRKYATILPRTTLVRRLARVSRRAWTQESSLVLSSGLAMESLMFMSALNGNALFSVNEAGTAIEPFRRMLRLRSHGPVRRLC